MKVQLLTSVFAFAALAQDGYEGELLPPSYRDAALLRDMMSNSDLPPRLQREALLASLRRIADPDPESLIPPFPEDQTTLAPMFVGEEEESLIAPSVPSFRRTDELEAPGAPVQLEEKVDGPAPTPDGADALPAPAPEAGDELPVPSPDELVAPSGDELPAPSGDELPAPSGDELPAPLGDELPAPTMARDNELPAPTPSRRDPGPAPMFWEPEVEEMVAPVKEMELLSFEDFELPAPMKMEMLKPLSLENVATKATKAPIAANRYARAFSG